MSDTDRATRPYDIILWGATGFTGALVAEYLVRRHPGLKWALAGRNRGKLEAARADLAKIDPASAALPILLADARDAASLATLVRDARVIVTTVGPYALHGRELVAACVAAGTDYCDLTGEAMFVREMIDAHHDAAVKSGARIVNCCGFDSIPSDLGALMVQEAARARLGRPCAEVRFLLAAQGGGVSGGTIASVLNMVEAMRADPGLRRRLADPYLLVPDGTGADGDDQHGVRFDAQLDRWTGPFVMAAINSRVVRRSNALLGYAYGRDFRYGEVVSFPAGPAGWAKAAAMTAGVAGFLGAITVGPVRSFLQRTVLPAPGQGPTRANRERGFFKIDLVGLDAGQVVVRARVEGQHDPGYTETAKMLSEAAILLAQAPAISGGGVLTPAVAMGMPLVERLRAQGMAFAID